MNRTNKVLPAELDHAHSLEAAGILMRERAYGMISFERDTGADAVHLLTALLHVGRTIPFIILTEDANEDTVAEIIRRGRWNYLAKSQLDGATLIRTIRSARKIHALT